MGTYWVSFEVRGDSEFSGGMPEDPPNPILNEALWDGSQSLWLAYDGTDIGIRIDGYQVAEPVPEPATMLLLGSGLIGLVGLRRKLKK